MQYLFGGGASSSIQDYSASLRLHRGSPVQAQAQAGGRGRKMRPLQGSGCKMVFKPSYPTMLSFKKLKTVILDLTKHFTEN